MRHLARERIGMASEKMKTRYDARSTGHDFHEGDKVWLWNPKRHKGLSPKLQTNWEGPYIVLKRLNDVVVRIHKSPHSKPKSPNLEMGSGISRQIWKWYMELVTKSGNNYSCVLSCHISLIYKDGATCHTARATIELLKDTFGDRLISRLGPVNWPPRSCDLTPLDYFLWGYVKSLVYADKPRTLDHLEDNIRRVIADIRTQMLEKVIENWTSRLDYIRASRGSPMSEIIFKM
ncbi:uncharacterized protein TNCV_4762111 [Trichonephila clavipes]|nr:uncharacterized protein TNCV_4762111 [Trichonephila clavipes]